MKTRARGGIHLMAMMALAMPMSAMASTPTTPEELESRAEVMAREARTAWNAAELYLEAAAMREAGDPLAVRNLREAGRLAWASGRESRAVRAFAEAGETALRFGDVLTAAESFVDAAWVAGKMGDAERALAYGERARDLTHSPLLAESDRARLIERIGAGTSSAD
jgi:uncharacterized protein YceH (UPF0502 family)